MPTAQKRKLRKSISKSMTEANKNPTSASRQQFLRHKAISDMKIDNEFDKKKNKKTALVENLSGGAFLSKKKKEIKRKITPEERKKFKSLFFVK